MHTYDIGLLTHQNPAAVIDFLMLRYKKDIIFTTADPLLISVNPFKDLKDATQEVIKKYRTTPEEKLQPHNFLIAKRALMNIDMYV